MNPKKDYEKAVKKSVSMPQIMFDRADRRRQDLTLTTFSDYLQMLMRQDLGEKSNAEKKIAA